MASSRPAIASVTACSTASYATRPASADSTPGVNRSRSAAVRGPYSTGSHTAVTRGSVTTLIAISGPIPAGSPIVTPTRTRVRAVMVLSIVAVSWAVGGCDAAASGFR